MTRQTIHCLFEQKITSICTTMFVFRRLLPAYSSLARFPQLIFTKDNSAEYKAEMEHLLNKAKLNDTGFGGEWGWNQEKLMSQDRCHSRILVVYHQQFFRNFDLKRCISMERNQCSLYSMALMFSFQTLSKYVFEFESWVAPLKVLCKYIISSSAIKEETIFGRRDKDVNVSTLAVLPPYVYCLLFLF